MSNYLNMVSTTINGFLKKGSTRKKPTYKVFINGTPKYRRSLSAARKLATRGRKNLRIYKKTPKGWRIVR